MFLATSLLLLFAIVGGDIASADAYQHNTNKLYCDPNLCQLFNGTHYVQYDHIGCNTTGKFSLECHEAVLFDMNSDIKSLILDLHNWKRNRIASGQLKGYNAAVAMPVIKWDKELQYLAGLNVKTCQFEHDACRNTYRFPHSGQNIAIFSQTIPIQSSSILEIIVNSVSDWFYEYTDAGQEFIDSFKNHPQGKKIGHFTQMVSDRTQRVGCAAILYRTSSEFPYNFLLTCNYDFTNILHQKVYVKGRYPGTKCSEGRSKRFKGLCDWKEH